MSGPFDVDPGISDVLFGNTYVGNHAVRMVQAMVAYAVQQGNARGRPEQPEPEQIWQPAPDEFCLEDFVLAHDVHLQYLNYKGPTAILLPAWVHRWARLGVLRRRCASELVLLPPWQSPADPWFALGLTSSTGQRPHDRVEILLPETWRHVAFLWCASPMAAIPQGPFMAPPNEIEGNQ